MRDKMPRVQEIVLPLLRENLDPSVTVCSWFPAVEDRKYPIVQIRRIGGRASASRRLMDHPVISVQVFTLDGPIEPEELYNDVLTVLDEAVRNQTTTDVGYLASLDESAGWSQAPAFAEDIWMVSGTVRLTTRPLRD